LSRRDNLHQKFPGWQFYDYLYNSDAPAVDFRVVETSFKIIFRRLVA
jgi:hypothetical protein